MTKEAKKLKVKKGSKVVENQLKEEINSVLSKLSEKYTNMKFDTVNEIVDILLSQDS